MSRHTAPCAHFCGALRQDAVLTAQRELQDLYRGPVAGSPSADGELAQTKGRLYAGLQHLVRERERSEEQAQLEVARLSALYQHVLPERLPLEQPLRVAEIAAELEATRQERETGLARMSQEVPAALEAVWHDMASSLPPTTHELQGAVLSDVDARFGAVGGAIEEELGEKEATERGSTKLGLREAMQALDQRLQQQSQQRRDSLQSVLGECLGMLNEAGEAVAQSRMAREASVRQRQTLLHGGTSDPTCCDIT